MIPSSSGVINGIDTNRQALNNSPLRIAFVQTDDARSVRSWSGTLYFSKQAIERHVGRVIDLTPAPINLLPYRAIRKALRHRVSDSAIMATPIMASTIMKPSFLSRGFPGINLNRPSPLKDRNLLIPSMARRFYL